MQKYPLKWPDGWPRTLGLSRTRGTFKVSFDQARVELLDELQKLGASDVTISTNVPLRQDGQPMARYAERQPDDPGIAVYFRRSGRPASIACDAYTTLAANMRSIGLSVAALRAMQRYGASQLMERAMSGFAALPAAIALSARPWWEVLELAENATFAEARAARNRLALRYHPDSGTTPHSARMAEVNAAFAEAEAALSRG